MNRPDLDAALTPRILFRAGWSLVQGGDAALEPGYYVADTSSDGYYLLPAFPGEPPIVDEAIASAELEGFFKSRPTEGDDGS